LFSVFSDNPEYMNLRELLLTQDLQQLGMWQLYLSCDQIRVMFKFKLALRKWQEGERARLQWEGGNMA
jgi:hypothetical protein